MHVTVDRRGVIFSTEIPEHLAADPRVYRSLETFDAVLLLVAMGQYPQALICCEEAVRLARPAELGDATPGGLLSYDESALRLFQTALPALDAAYQALGWPGFRANLWPDVGEHLAIAEALMASTKAGENPRTNCRSLEHAIRWTIRENFMAPWMIEVDGRRERGDDVWDRPFAPGSGVELECPMCGMSTGCEIDHNDDGPLELWVEAMHCLECGFRIGPKHKRLSKVLFQDELVLHRDEIVKDYGLQDRVEQPGAQEDLF